MERDIGQYTMEYRKNGTLHRLWLEDARSLSEKFRLGAKLGLAGYAYWHIGYVSPGIWTNLETQRDMRDLRYNEIGGASTCRRVH